MIRAHTVIEDARRASVALALLFACPMTTAAQTASARPPSVIFAGLFEDVQRSGIFADSKTFPDAIPRAPADAILSSYRSERGRPGFDLREFVARFFTLPQTPGVPYVSDPRAGVCAHIDSLWPVLTRAADSIVAGSSLLPLPHRYVVPGGRFREIYY